MICHCEKAKKHLIILNDCVVRRYDAKGKCRIKMIKENGKIKEISENEAFCMFLDNEYYMAMDFYEFRNRLEEAGAKITKS